MCMASCLYFLTRYYWIKTRNRIQRFAFRQGQWILWLMMCELDRLGVSKMMQILKARQLEFQRSRRNCYLGVSVYSRRGVTDRQC